MGKIGIDTNIVVTIVKDEPQQSKISLSILQEAETYICRTVILENDGFSCDRLSIIEGT